MARLWLTLALLLSPLGYACGQKNLIIDTDLFSDVDDAGALLIAATAPNVNLLAVNVNYPSSYSALCASAILGYYGQNVPIGIRKPFTNVSYFDNFYYQAGEYASKIAYHHSGGNLTWGNADDAWDAVSLYRKVLSEADDNSVTIASIGFFENLSDLLNSTADEYSSLDGPDLITAKVSELVIMGGNYPSGYEYNFWGDNPISTAHVVNNWKTTMVFSGADLGGNVTSGVPLITQGPENDPVRQAYLYYTHGTSRYSWDPLTVLYAIEGLDSGLFEYGNEYGYNYVHPNGSNEWVFDEQVSNQHWLNLKVDNVTAGAELDDMFLSKAWSAV
ncbi:inosine/uridine-preferring nucleoside hydrolase [Pestalotiopsis sp. NC0098]|nr:inosine/uridine-preferring nucleoside hydrolase [Pestalotiopsis sp. NC0098]